ncbi:site-specific recombinase resolvase [Xanthomonas albilineans]|uniref:site-specific recombinase resolvase n=1 Tax=Xanthomonas albilineans TaxID=29447 RepID=UPI0027D93FFE|nr:site-specific recombinase resolvase [Xanthomonas albilineans]
MDASMETFVPLKLGSRGVQRAPAGEGSVHDVTLIQRLALAFYWQHLLDIGAMPSGSAIARAENLDQSVVNESKRMTLLAPDIVEQCMAGKQPQRLTLAWFQRNRLMVDWDAQRQLMASLEEEV